MISERHGGAVLVWAPAKVNLFLEVFSKRADGYHEIATLMAAVTLWDTLEFQEEPSGSIVVVCDHPTLSTGADNLVNRAAERLRSKVGSKAGARIRLRKRIPLAAGLAGGSSDAAATLQGLNQLWRLGLGTPELGAIAAELGSDVPFFFATPVAWCTGRGEVVEPLSMSGSLWFVIVCLSVGLSTADVYRNVSVPTSPKSGKTIRQAVQAGNVESVAAELHNRLEEPAFRLCPEVAEVRARLEQLKPAGVLMSGSGTSVFALCRNQEEATRVAREFRRTSNAGSGAIHVVRSCP